MFIDQVQLDQRRQQIGTPKHGEIGARLPLQLGHLHADVVLDQSLESRLDSERRETVVHWLRNETGQLAAHLDRVTHGLSAPVVRRLRTCNSHVPKEVSKSHADS